MWIQPAAVVGKRPQSLSLTVPFCRLFSSVQEAGRLTWTVDMFSRVLHPFYQALTSPAHVSSPQGRRRSEVSNNLFALIQSLINVKVLTGIIWRSFRQRGRPTAGKIRCATVQGPALKNRLPGMNNCLSLLHVRKSGRI
ncbi:hypothetical protein M758_8G183600 [Ceratodon purpureus]|uniref:Uncharacterized protein n=1 Tax=Ceratodon purpureus TaxID=3225 RepID=A0A8T0GZZ2_CERPU|nr:hypothetical protein KC19_8G188200 [Ceratodon purpureus]KAG0609428.1 hypothetical protein M758_8G183600 [Ceratodon purpureus]